MTDNKYDLIVVGTGFASTFFLKSYLASAPKTSRILVLERGRINNASPGKEYLSNNNISFEDTYINMNRSKGWVQRIGFGGGTCWTGNTPRMHPNDFKTSTLYGVGDDWPISYDDIEPYYAQVEDVMGISGEAHKSYPRSKQYPLPAHRLNALDREFLKKYPNKYLSMPSARASSSKAGRSTCCSNGICPGCPIAAKFQIDFHLKDVYKDKRVTLITEANVTHIDIANKVVQGVSYIKDNREHHVHCDLAAIGAHGIMTPFIMKKSGLNDPALGKYLNEQMSISIDVLLKGVKNYDGSQYATGLGIMGLDGDFRRERPGYILENWNVPWLRAERGRWTERGFFKLVFEELPEQRNYVTISREDPTKPEVHYIDHSDYAKTAINNIDTIVSDLLNNLPVEKYHININKELGGDAHIQGTTRMGTDHNTSVVDKNLIHHHVRNLVVLGSGVFTSCPAANPTLTLSALSIMAADNLF